MTKVIPFHDIRPDPCDQMDIRKEGSMLRRWFGVALSNLLIAALLGCLLRMVYVVELPFVRFKAVLHAHSHVAMLGWMFIATTIFIFRMGDPKAFGRWARRLLVLVQLAVLGMLFSFPVEGYGPFSIASSSLHLLVSYALTWHLWRAISTWDPNGSRPLARMALIFMVLSTLGVWAVPVITANGLFGTEIYYWSIQFFLHFQFNGWLWFASLALWSRWAEVQGTPTPLDRTTIRLWTVSAFLTFALAIAWSERHFLVYAVNSVGVLLQLWAGWRTAKSISSTQQRLHASVPMWAWRCVTYALIGMGIKVTVQAAVAIPQVATLAFTIRNFVVGFIHLNMLGALSLMLFAMALLAGWWRSTDPLARSGLTLFTSGVVLTEALLFGQGLAWWLAWGTLPGYYLILVLVSLLIPAGVILLVLHNRRHSEQLSGPEHP